VEEWKTASASPHDRGSGARERTRPPACTALVADPRHPQRTLHKDSHRTGGDLFLFTHLTVEVSVFIYLLLRTPYSAQTEDGRRPHRRTRMPPQPSYPTTQPREGLGSLGPVPLDEQQSAPLSR